MSAIQWFGVVFAAFMLVFSVFRMWNKDTRGAVLAVLALVLGAFALLSIGGCTLSREYQPWLEVGFALDTQKTVGSNPACIVGVRQPIGFGPIPPDWLVVGYSHQSSCPDLFDRNTVDQFEVRAKIPLGRDK